MHVVRLAALALAAISVTACSGNPETGTGPKENTGTVVGALAGGLSARNSATEPASGSQPAWPARQSAA